jgi:hypothetical protein
MVTFFWRSDGQVREAISTYFARVLKRVTAERPPGLGCEDRVCRSAAALGEPDAQDGNHSGRERRDPQLPSLSQTADMRASAEMDIGAPKADQFGYP